MRVTGQSADGRTGTSGTLSARRLVRQVCSRSGPHLDIPNGTGGIATGFRGTTFTPSGRASTGPRPPPSRTRSPPACSGPRSARWPSGFFHEVQPNPPRTRVVNLAIPFPSGPRPEPRRLRHRGHRPPPPPGHGDGVVTTGEPEAGGAALRAGTGRARGRALPVDGRAGRADEADLWELAGIGPGRGSPTWAAARGRCCRRCRRRSGPAAGSTRSTATRRPPRPPWSPRPAWPTSRSPRPGRPHRP